MDYENIVERLEAGPPYEDTDELIGRGRQLNFRCPDDVRRRLEECIKYQRSDQSKFLRWLVTEYHTIFVEPKLRTMRERAVGGRPVAKLTALPKPEPSGKQEWLAELAELRRRCSTGKAGGPTVEEILAEDREERF